MQQQYNYDFTAQCNLYSDSNYYCAAGLKMKKICCYHCERVEDCPMRCLNHPTRCREYKKVDKIRAEREIETDRDYRIYKDYQRGMTQNEIGKKYQLCDRRIQQIVKKIKENRK